MSVKDDLIAARKLIDTPEKWGKGPDSYLRASGPACAHEALRRTIPVGHEALRRNLEVALPDGFDGVPEFNDDPSTTHADVMALFDRAIAAAGASS